jgi:hypothetical protein
MREPKMISHRSTCSHGGALPARENFGQGFRYFIWCERCQKNVTKVTGAGPGDYLHWESLIKIRPGLVEAAVPLRETSMPRYCEGPCKQFCRCQQHHVLPKGLLAPGAKSFADDWPLFWLCKECHDFWHNVVTPGLETPYHAEEHVIGLSQYLKPAQLQQLLFALQRKLKSEAA